MESEMEEKTLMTTTKNNNLNISFEQLDDNITIVTINGNLLTNIDVDNVLDNIKETIDTNHLIIDLSRADYVSSSGLTLFLRLLTKTRINDKKLILCNLQEKLEKLFHITKLYDIFAISNSVEEAIKTLK